MFKNLKLMAIKKVIKSQLKNVPKEQAEMVETLLERNPELLMKIAEDTQKLMKEGKNQMAASMEVMKKYAPELQQTLGNRGGGNPRPF